MYCDIRTCAYSSMHTDFTYRYFTYRTADTYSDHWFLLFFYRCSCSKNCCMHFLHRFCFFWILWRTQLTLGCVRWLCLESVRLRDVRPLSRRAMHYCCCFCPESLRPAEHFSTNWAWGCSETFTKRWCFAGKSRGSSFGWDTSAWFDKASGCRWACLTCCCCSTVDWLIDWLIEFGFSIFQSSCWSAMRTDFRRPGRWGDQNRKARYGKQYFSGFCCWDTFHLKSVRLYYSTLVQHRDWLFDCSFGWLIDLLTDSLSEWVIDWLINWSFDWLFDWLIDCIVVSCFFSTASGDETRNWGPPFIGSESCYFLSVNRNKKVGVHLLCPYVWSDPKLSAAQ